MIKSVEKLRNLSSLLNKDNPVLIAEAVEMLRDEEPFEGAVGLLAACYDKNSAVMVNNAIESFMNDLKDKSLRAEIISEIKKDHRPETTSMLVASCWQSGLDYSAFSADLAEVFISSDYGIALECLTVIEESIPVLTAIEKNKLLSILKNGSTSESDVKKTLTLDLISRLEE